MGIDFRAEFQPEGLVMLYPETEAAETYADVLLIDEQHQGEVWSGGIAFDIDEAREILDRLEADGFEIEETH